MISSLHLPITPRKIANIPYRVVDIANMEHNFYYNLIEWTHNDMFCMGLNHSVYLWNLKSNFYDVIGDAHEKPSSVKAQPNG
jgi:predicted enzyme related to lactoylglutathione lyase